MKFYSTNDRNHRVDLKEAVFRGLPPDRGLYMPERITPLPPSFFEHLPTMDLPETGFHVARQLIGDSVPEAEMRRIVVEAIDFPAPLVTLNERTHILELFHGPSLAFKDFGARFMARLMAYLNDDDRPLIILVATSGDTGGAVAAGFHGTPGIEVVILYPSGKVSALQEKQLTTLDGNVHALEVDGTFDDCQALVKEAFVDEELRGRLRLSSANSINIARLIPQSFYYFDAYRQLGTPAGPVVFSIPSGNFGNLTAGLLAQQLGLPVDRFIAATNRNDVVPQYLASGSYLPRPSVATLSNAMDVGAPSNFVRMLGLHGHNAQTRHSDKTTHQRLRKKVSGYAYDDAATEAAMREVYRKYGYTLDPHGAVGYLALRAHQLEQTDTVGIVLETAHPAKFLPDVERVLERNITVPKRLARLADQTKQAWQTPNNFSDLRDWLCRQFT